MKSFLIELETLVLNSPVAAAGGDTKPSQIHCPEQDGGDGGDGGCGGGRDDGGGGDGDRGKYKTYIDLTL